MNSDQVSVKFARTGDGGRQGFRADPNYILLAIMNLALGALVVWQSHLLRDSAAKIREYGDRFATVSEALREVSRVCGVK
jgi:hypothetical protein